MNKDLLKSKTEQHSLQLLNNKSKMSLVINMSHRVWWVNNLIQWNKVWTTLRVNTVNLPRSSWKRHWKMMIFKASFIHISEVAILIICPWYNKAILVILEDQERALDENGESVVLKTKLMTNYRYMRLNLQRVNNKLLTKKERKKIFHRRSEHKIDSLEVLICSTSWIRGIQITGDLKENISILMQRLMIILIQV